ncbi:hypothetical protein DYH09_16520 [bacterium CPR1]|nr:hypothetical protein [bacterium CPR1]
MLRKTVIVLAILALLLSISNGGPMLWVAGALLAGLVAVNLVASSLWPERVEKSRHTLELFPLRSFLLGILIVLLEIFLVLSLPLKGLLVLAAVVANLVFLAQGLPALAERIGQGLSLTEKRATAAGTALIGLVFGLPVLGWLAGACLGLSALGAPLAGER